MSQRSAALIPPAASASCAALIVLAIVYGDGPLIGIGGGTTSSDYIQGAFGLLHDLAYRYCDGRPVLHFPPGYSTLLALALSLGFSVTGAVAAVGVLSAALTGWWTAEHFYRWFASRWLAAAGTLLVTLNPVSLRWYLEGHSDGLFAALALGCVVYFAAYA